MGKKYCLTDGFGKFTGTHLIVKPRNADNFAFLQKISKTLKNRYQALKVKADYYNPYICIGRINTIQICKEVVAWEKRKLLAMN